MDREIDETLKHAIKKLNAGWALYEDGKLTLDNLVEQLVDFTATTCETLRKIHQRKHKRNNILPFPKNTHESKKNRDTPPKK
ncbi:hypothetical protein [Desulfurivibrio sp. C05AmB]|uniref:hypothetical protein n=1 Tax=Desulfurivibrio sp. C05AmB TaxID=3374371 RepID=UPI00376F243F